MIIFQNIPELTRIRVEEAKLEGEKLAQEVKSDIIGCFYCFLKANGS